MTRFTLVGKTMKRRIPGVALPLVLTVLIVVATTSGFGQADQAPGRAYLALGDSVTFGFITNAGFAYFNPDNFIGFPNYIGQALKLNDTNAACPGETTGSFLSSTAADLGCRFFRSLAPLHVSYNSTQLDFALSFLRSHPQTRLVTINLGANDLTLAACSGDPQCVTASLQSVEVNLQTILADLRTAGFNGTLL